MTKIAASLFPPNQNEDCFTVLAYKQGVMRQFVVTVHANALHTIMYPEGTSNINSVHIWRGSVI